MRGLARRRPDLTVTTLRFANFLGPTANTPMAQYFSLPVIPTVLGYDARLQFVHEDDGLEVLRRATVEDHPGTYNVAGEASWPSRRRSAVPGASGFPCGPRSWASWVAGSAAGGSPTSARSRSGCSTHGRAVDTTRLREEFGYTPQLHDRRDVRRLRATPGG